MGEIGLGDTGADAGFSGYVPGMGVNAGLSAMMNLFGQQYGSYGSPVPYGEYGQMSNQFGVSQGGYGAYMTQPGGGISGIGVNTTPYASRGAGGVYRVNPYTGGISAVPMVGTSYGSAMTGRPNPAYGQAAGAPAPTSTSGRQFSPGQQVTYGDLGLGNNQRAGFTSNTVYGTVQAGPNGVMGLQRPDGTFQPLNNAYLAGGTGGVGPAMGAGLGGTDPGLEGLAAMGQRRLGEQASEQNERLAEDYQRRGMTQSGLLSEAQARQTRDQGYALADFLAQLYGRGSTYGMSNIQGLSASNRQDQQRGPSDYQDLQGAFMQQMLGQQLSPDIMNMLRELMGGGSSSGGYLDYSGLYTDPLVSEMSA